MDCPSHKFYHEDGFDPRAFLDSYVSSKAEVVFGHDCLKFPMANFHYMFSCGFVSGDICIDFSLGSFIHHLYSACEVFREIIILKLQEKCSMEMRRWLCDRTGAYDWTHASAHATKLDGKSAQILDKETRMKEAISHVVSCNFKFENITHPVVLPLADCIISYMILELISKDEDEYMRNLEKVCKLLKVGGRLVLMGGVKMSFLMVGGDKIHSLALDEDSIKSALCRLGFVIEYCAVQKKMNASNLADYESNIFITACKRE